MDGDPAAQAPVSMLARVVAILDAFNDDKSESSLAALALKTGIPKPSLFRITKSLVEAGILERCPAGFCLGLKVFELGQLVELAPATS